MRLLTVSPRSGRQKKLQIRDVRAAAAARCAGLAANVPTFPGLRRLALGYTLHQLHWWATNFSLSIAADQLTSEPNDKLKFVGHTKENAQ